MDTETAKTPVHLWIVGIVALLWNCIGPTDYLMTRLHQDSWIEMGMPGVDPQIVYSYIDSMPIWSHIGWGLGVWGGLIGSILLIARSRYAVHVFGASLLGVAMSLGWQLLVGPDMPPEMTTSASSQVMPYVIIAIAIGLFVYARAMRIKGVLR